MQGREYDPALTVSNTGPDRSQPEPLWHVKTRTDARGLHFFEVGTKDGSHYITVSGNRRWMSRDENSARRLAAKANSVLNEAILEAGRIEPETAEPGTTHDHKPVQHRDGKPPWCRECGLTAEGEQPVSRLRSSDGSSMGDHS